MVSASMSTKHSCSICRAKLLPPGRLRRLCPACLLKFGMEEEGSAGFSGETDSDEPFAFLGETGMAGQRLSHYEISHEVSRGGMGIVYRARDTKLKRDVAIKVLPPELVADRDRKRRFIQEAQAAASLNHPNIGVIHEIDESGGVDFIVMELIDGVELGDLLDEGSLPLERALEIGIDLTKGLARAHDHGVIHRDLKPPNIIISYEGHVKIIDFGLAKLVESGGSLDDDLDTAAGAGSGKGCLLGTVPYMSPEQVEGKPVDVRTDVFSLGVVLYEMTTGQRPFRSDSARGVLSSILKDTPSLVSEVRSGLPESLARVIERCLKKDPNERFANGRAVHETLKALGEDVFTSPWRPRTGAPWLSVPSHTARANQERPRPLIGRDNELAELRRGLHGVSEGYGHLHLIAGEPGVGKTRLAQEILFEARMLGMETLVGHCYEEGAAPFIPYVEILTDTAGRVPAPELKEALGDVAPEVAQIVPALSRLFPDLEKPAERPPELRQRHLFDGLLQFWRRLTEVKPYVLFLDDLHWADASSASLLQHLSSHLKSTPPLPLFIVGAYRDVELEMRNPFEKTLTELIRARLAQRLSLRRLPLESVGELLSMLGRADPPDRLVRTIYQETEGNPFFVEEVFQHLSEDGKLFDSEGEWKSDLRIDELDVPAGVRLVIGRRLARLSADTLKILGSAAVIGRRFEVRLIESLRSFEPETLLDALEEAESAKLILEMAGEHEATYSFTHELIRQTLLGTISLPRRRHLHVQVAVALERVHRDRLEARAAEVARHLYLAGSAAERGKTIRYLELAGDSAQTTASSEAALQFFEQALTLLEDQDDLNETKRADLLRKRGLAQRGLGRWDDMERDLGSALILYEQGRHREGAARICRELAYHLTWTARAGEAREVAERGLRSMGDVNSKSRCRLLSAAGLAHSIAGDAGPSVRLAEEAEALARKLDEPRLLAEVLRDHMLIDFQRLYAIGIVEQGEHALNLMQSINARWELSNSLGVLMIGYMLRGELKSAERIARRTESLSHLQADVGLQVHLLNRQALQEQARGDLSACADSWRSLVELLRKTGYPVSLHLGLMGLSFSWLGRRQEANVVFGESVAVNDEWQAWIGTKAGCRVLSEAYCGEPEALELVNAGRNHLPEAGVHNAVGNWNWLMANVEALALLGERKRCGELYPLTLDLIATTARVSFGFGLVEKFAAISAAAAERWRESQVHFEYALQQAEQIPHVLEQTEVRRWYAWMLRDRNMPGDRDRARDLLEDCLTCYREIGMPFHQDIVTTLLSP